MSLGSHGEYAQEQLTIYASGAPTFSGRAREREREEGGREEWGRRREDRREEEKEGGMERVERVRSEDEWEQSRAGLKG